ncbi:hypothetical protein PR202_gb03384 [Eleusine coracana subsp. coracana]|uniref:Golgin candidate 4 n=1 Tax=Eleusine coracana subsp. coracana TaxID=191504 RepID=A0AAV5E1A4_ELECO|nr:hypothetical protein PR202_gb03384 [Eleusine coracana subsp. coracana]
MRSSIATYRESLSRLAGEVDEAAADEVPAPPTPVRGGDSAPTPPSSGRRRRYSRPGSNTAEPDEISKLKDEIQKLQASEAEIKALSFNYAAILKEKEGNVLEEEQAYFATKQATLESEIKQLKQQLSNNTEKETEMKRRLEDENKQNEFLQQQLNELRTNNDSVSTNMEELRMELSEKKSELRCVQDELSKREKQHISDGSFQSLRNMVLALQKENSELKVKEELASLERALQEASRERDKAVQDLARLKQHLLDKDLEDQEKMDEDSKLIEELRLICDQQRNHIMQLERALKTEMAKQEESKKITNQEHQRSNEQIEDLKYKLASCMNALESKNVELLNLQTALGQYYAESEAKDRLGGDLAIAREEVTKLSESLKVANGTIEISRREKEGIATKLSQVERMLADGKHSMQKLEDDNSRLRRALEQSMTTVNRMSLDSDNSVDRRIVIKLLVTYFQRNHSKEVLDLMVRMLGFSEEDKQRIGLAQSSAGKGVVRGVLGLPGRLVGGIVGGSSPGKSTNTSQDNQSFADLWVDFLLKETEEREKQEREKREASEAAMQSQEDSQTTSCSSNSSSLQPSQLPANLALDSSTRPHLFGCPDSDFSTVPLASSTVPLASSTYSSVQTPFSRPPPR